MYIYSVSPIIGHLEQYIHNIQFKRMKSEDKFSSILHNGYIHYKLNWVYLKIFVYLKLFLGIVRGIKIQRP